MEPEKILFMYQEFLEKHEGDLFPYDIACWINENFVPKNEVKRCKTCEYKLGKSCNNCAVIDSNYMGIKIDFRIGKIEGLNCPMEDMIKIFESIKANSKIVFAENFGCIHHKEETT